MVRKPQPPYFLDLQGELLTEMSGCLRIMIRSIRMFLWSFQNVLFMTGNQMRYSGPGLRNSNNEIKRKAHNKTPLKNKVSK